LVWHQSQRRYEATRTGSFDFWWGEFLKDYALWFIITKNIVKIVTI